MVEIRCQRCHKLLGKAIGTVEIKCPRCGELNTQDTEHRECQSAPPME